MPPWVIVWVASVMEAILVVSGFVTGNPRAALFIQQWLQAYAKFGADKVLYLYRLAETLAESTGARVPLVLADKMAFVNKVMAESDTELYETLKFYDVPLHTLGIYILDLRAQIALQLIRDIVNNTPAPARLPLSPLFFSDMLRQYGLY